MVDYYKSGRQDRAHAFTVKSPLFTSPRARCGAGYQKKRARCEMTRRFLHLMHTVHVTNGNGEK